MSTVDRDLGAAYRAALGWLRASATVRLEGTADADSPRVPSLGQLLGTLLDCGERGLADSTLERLLATQLSDGSWDGGLDRTNARETADAVRGLQAALPSRPAVEASLRRARDWWRDRDPLEAARGFEPDGRPALPGHSHHAPLDLLLDLGRAEAVEQCLRDAEQEQRADGAIPAHPGAAWSCLSCVAALAAAWYRTGRRTPADRALGFLLAAQDESGALPETAEPGANASSRSLSPAATRGLLEAIHAHIAGAFAGQVGDFEDRTRQGDGRLGFLLLEAGPLAGRRVLDAGSGRGCLARALLTAYPSVALFAVDLSPEMLAHVPAAVPTRRGSVQSLPFEDGGFDVVYCVEALEHAGNPQGAVDELCRVVRPGGRVLIVDKNAERAGALEIEAWESWFGRREVESWLRRHCADVRSDTLLHCPELGPDLFIGWRGTRSRG